MRHRNSRVRLPGIRSKANADLHNLLVGLLTHGWIQTTIKRAKVLRPKIERLITKGKKCAISADFARKDALYRQILAELRNNNNAAALVTRAWGPYFIGTNGGYTRILRTYFRQGDNAEMAVIEFVLDEKTSGGDEDMPNFSHIIEATKAHQPNGIRFLSAWRSIPSPNTKLTINTEDTPKGKIQFSIDVNLPTLDNSLLNEWPKFHGRYLAMLIEVFVAAPRTVDKSKIRLDIEGPIASNSGRAASLNFKLTPETEKISVKGLVDLSDHNDELPFCDLILRSPKGEIFFAELI